MEASSFSCSAGESEEYFSGAYMLKVSYSEISFRNTTLLNPASHSHSVVSYVDSDGERRSPSPM